MNIPNVNAVQQQTEMAESMVSRNAALAEESIRLVLLPSACSIIAECLLWLWLSIVCGERLLCTYLLVQSYVSAFGLCIAALIKDHKSLDSQLFLNVPYLPACIKIIIVEVRSDCQCALCRAAEATAAEARRKYEAAKLAADEAERARLAAEGLSQEAQARKSPGYDMLGRIFQCLVSSPGGHGGMYKSHSTMPTNVDDQHCVLRQHGELTCWLAFVCQGDCLMPACRSSLSIAVLLLTYMLQTQSKTSMWYRPCWFDGC